MPEHPRAKLVRQSGTLAWKARRIHRLECAHLYDIIRIVEVQSLVKSCGRVHESLSQVVLGACLGIDGLSVVEEKIDFHHFPLIDRGQSSRIIRHQQEEDVGPAHAPKMLHGDVRVQYLLQEGVQLLEQIHRGQVLQARI